jgi:hypothetical protein
MDTKPLEIESESYIQHELIKHDFKVTKPTFDKEGADLLIVDSIKAQYTHFLKIQCKGRTLKSNGSYVDIPKSYVTKHFVVFLYVVDEAKESSLFVFFYDEIIKWKVRGDKYVLNFTFSKLEEQYFLDSKFGINKVALLHKELKQSKIKKYTSFLVDKSYLNDAIDKTIEIYKEIYPERIFERPTIDVAIKSILSMYDNFRTSEKIINCYVFSSDEDTDNTVHNSKIVTDDGVKVKVYTDVTDGVVSFEMQDHLERIINTENVMLASNDILFEEQLNCLKEKGVDVTLILYSTGEGRNIFTKHRWGDIIYPLAQALGLSRYEW